VKRVGWIDTDPEGADLADWADIPEPETVEFLAEVAFERLAEYAPKPLPEPDEVPARYRLAQVLLTQHLAARKSAGDDVSQGVDGLMTRTWPLVREAYDCIRPRRSVFAGML